MEFDTYSRESKKYAFFPKEEALTYTALGLTGEAGEYAEKVKKYLRDGALDREKALAELGDVLWYLARCAEQLGSNLSEVAHKNLVKLESRQQRGTLGGSGDNR